MVYKSTIPHNTILLKGSKKTCKWVARLATPSTRCSFKLVSRQDSGRISLTLSAIRIIVLVVFGVRWRRKSIWPPSSRVLNIHKISVARSGHKIATKLVRRWIQKRTLVLYWFVCRSKHIAPCSKMARLLRKLATAWFEKICFVWKNYQTVARLPIVESEGAFSDDLGDVKIDKADSNEYILAVPNPRCDGHTGSGNPIPDYLPELLGK